MSIDSRGFKAIVQEEAKTFLEDRQLMLGATVEEIWYSANGVKVVLAGGRTLEADYVICTFRYD